VFRKTKGAKSGLRMLLARRLLVISFVVFIIMAPLSWLATGFEALIEAREDMVGVTSYFLTQLELDSTNDNMLEGSSASNIGLIITANTDGTVIASNSRTLENAATIRDFLSDEICNQLIFIDPATTEYPIVESVDQSEVSGYFTAEESSKLSPTYPFLIIVNRSGNHLVLIIRPVENLLKEAGSVMKWASRSIVVSLLVSFLLTLHLLHSKVVRPIQQTNNTLASIAGGDLDTRATATGTKEFDALSRDINHTVDILKGLIAEAATRMDSELATARAIQEGALPQIFPPFPDILRFDIYATMVPAREVGGDFYDFFLIGNCNEQAGKLAFVVADVSSKGIPAALFMMRAKTQIRDYLESGLEIGEAIENANHQLCEGNDAGMFVTAWVGVLDYATGHIDYVNAGHNPPLLWQKNVGWRWMRERSGPMLGVFDGIQYKAYSIDCKPSDTLLVYSDGVTEAMDTDEKLYGEQRLFDVADRGYRLHPSKLVRAIRHDVAAYAGDADQSDDITILALEVGVPPEVTATLVVPANVNELATVNDFVHAELGRRHCPVRTQSQLDIAVEELFVNQCLYAFPDRDGTVRVQCTYSADPPSIAVDLIDDGIPFNPLEKPDAVTPSNLDEVPIGGLGILMAKRSVDSMSYERIDDNNVVTITKRW